jgi:hypothetical protein
MRCFGATRTHQDDPNEAAPFAHGHPGEPPGQLATDGLHPGRSHQGPSTPDSLAARLTPTSSLAVGPRGQRGPPNPGLQLTTPFRHDN